LIEKGISPSQIAIKSSETNEIENINLLSRDCEIRYIITKTALAEGWDCPFAYFLGIIPNTSSATGLTQLVGRTLRQPYQKRIGTKENPDNLDKSYIFYLKGDTGSVLDQIKKGLENNGLEDLATGIKLTNPDGTIEEIEDKTKTKKVKIRKDILDKYKKSLYLPVFWNKAENRRFDYNLDIEQNIDYSRFDFTPEFLTRLKNKLNDSQNREHFVIDFNPETGKFEKVVGDFIITKSNDEMTKQSLISNLGLFTKNPFISAKIANKFFAKIQEDKELQKAKDIVGSQITTEILKEFKEFRNQESEQVFEKMVEAEKVCLAFGEMEDGGFCFNQTVDSVQEEQKDEKYLYEKYDFATLNRSEELFKNKLIGNQKNLLWWYRNPERDTKEQINFSIQSFLQNNIRPDFIATKIDPETSKIKMVYILESKGRHLLGNEDTKNKMKVFEVLNKIMKEKKTVVLDKENAVVKLEPNQNIEACFVEQGEEGKINELFNE